MSAVIQSILTMWIRFPFVVGATVLGVFTAVIILKQRSYFYTAQPDWFMKLFLISLLACLFLLFLALIAERLLWRRSLNYLLQIAGVGLLTFYFWLLPTSVNDWYIQTNYRFGLSIILAVIGVLVIPWIGKADTLYGWQYWKILVQRFIITGIFSAALFIGLVLAVTAMNYLFHLELPGEIYPQLWVTVVGIFASWFFLASFPKYPHQDSTEYPRILRVFALYILLPLLGIFSAILAVYAGKIVVTWSWPLGGVALWVLLVAAWGLLTYTCVYPLFRDETYSWLRKVFVSFFILLLLLLVLLFLAVSVRIREYGLTDDRYLVIALGVWLAGVAFYLLISKQKRLEYLPVSLGLVLFLSAFGPWSSFSLSLKSQAHRLERLLTERGMLVDGKVKAQSEPMFNGSRSWPEEFYKKRFELESVLAYVIQHDGTHLIQPWFEEDLTAGQQKEGEFPMARTWVIQTNALRALGLSYDDMKSEHLYFNIAKSPPYVFSVAGYDQSAEGLFLGIDRPTVSLTTPDGILKIQLERDTMNIVREDKTLMALDLAPFAKNLYEKYEKNKQMYDTLAFPLAEMTIVKESEAVRIKLIINSLNVVYNEDQVAIEHLSGTLLFSLR